MKRIIKTLLPVFFILCFSCQKLGNGHIPYIRLIYTIDGETKTFEEDEYRGFLKEKYWATFGDYTEEGRVLFAFAGFKCHASIHLMSDEDVFIDGKQYYYDSNWGPTYFSGTGGYVLEAGWVTFHVVDQDRVCFVVSFDTVWLKTETGKTKNVSGALYVYDRYYGKYGGRVYRRFIVPEE